MRKITGLEQKGESLLAGDQVLVDALNMFFNRFDFPTTSCLAPEVNVSLLTISPPAAPLIFTSLQVQRELDRLNQGKAAGTDGISTKLLTACSSQLCEIFSHMFNLSQRLQRITSLWKTQCLVLVPKWKHPTDLKDYRPIALTSHIMKTLEKLLLSYIRPKECTFTDPLQSAYLPNISMEDTLIYMFQRVYAHLNNPSAIVRIMFFDFSSAFNTIQPNLLGEKMRRCRWSCSMFHG